MHARQAKASDTGTEREHRVWNNLVYLLLTQDYLLDNHIKKDLERRRIETQRENVRRREREKPKRMNEQEMTGGRLRIKLEKKAGRGGLRGGRQMRE